MPYDEEGFWWNDPTDAPLSPYEQAVAGGGQEAGDALIAAANQYYSDPSSFAETPNWFEMPGVQVPQSEVGGTTLPPGVHPTFSTPGPGGPGIVGPPPASSPRPSFSGFSGGGGGGGGNFRWPEFVAPRFDYKERFKAPSLQEAMNEPGYEFARREGIRALENSASGRGVLRTGGTLKDLVGWGNRFAEQNYGNVYNRSADVFGRNFDTAASVFDRNYKGAFDEFQPRFTAAERTFEDNYRRWKAQLDAETRFAELGAL